MILLLIHSLIHWLIPARTNSATGMRPRIGQRIDTKTSFPRIDTGLTFSPQNQTSLTIISMLVSLKDGCDRKHSRLFSDSIASVTHFSWICKYQRQIWDWCFFMDMIVNEEQRTASTCSAYASVIRILGPKTDFSVLPKESPFPLQCLWLAIKTNTASSRPKCLYPTPSGNKLNTQYWQYNTPRTRNWPTDGPTNGESLLMACVSTWLTNILMKAESAKIRSPRPC